MQTKKKKKNKKKDGLMEFKNETQTENYILFLSFDRSISSFFCVRVVCVLDGLLSILVRVYIERRKAVLKM